jgi:hypothetical protein
MGINVRWLDSRESDLYYEVVGKWTWDDLYRAVGEGIRLSAPSEPFTHVIIDVRRSQYVPLLTADHLSKVATLTDVSCASSGMVLVGAGHFVRLMFDIFRRIHPVSAARFRFVDTLDDLPTVMQTIS